MAKFMILAWYNKSNQDEKVCRFDKFKYIMLT